MCLEALTESSEQRSLCEVFFRSERYFLRASFSETPPIKNALAARPIAYVPVPAIMPQTIAPAGKKLQHRTGTFAEKHSCADVCAERRHKFCRSAQASPSTADVHDARDHHHLERGEDWHVCQRDRLR